MIKVAYWAFNGNDEDATLYDERLTHEQLAKDGVKAWKSHDKMIEALQSFKDTHALHAVNLGFVRPVVPAKK